MLGQQYAAKLSEFAQCVDNAVHHINQASHLLSNAYTHPELLRGAAEEMEAAKKAHGLVTVKLQELQNTLLQAVGINNTNKKNLYVDTYKNLEKTCNEIA